MPEITDTQSIQQFQQYIVMSDAPRMTMAHGVYPNSVKALDEYQALLDWLTANESYAQLHSNTTSQVAPYVAQMIACMETIIVLMRGIEQAAPGTFGIQLPVVEEQQPE